ncbi:MAG: hypothetical protein ACUVTM_03855 [Candidatus Bathyarchaeia archaeon]
MFTTIFFLAFKGLTVEYSTDFASTVILSPGNVEVKLTHLQPINYTTINVTSETINHDY